MVRFCKASKPRVHGFALKREHTEDALMDAPQRLTANETLQPFDAERELAQGQRSFPSQSPRPKTDEVRLGRVIRAVDDPQVFAPPAFDGGLRHTSATAMDKRQWLDHDPLTAS